ncbi:hypothetical protein DL765_001861 [Monosporascus sp. GIB2]|nr:hypothetical protein DL765_001861 [Monosporascus sp. GIB2]
MAGHTHEPTVRFSAPMPKGYAFVPKGNVYMTSHCRKQTIAAGETVFAVLDAKNRAIGIRVPAGVRGAVRASHDATRDERARAVRRRDDRREAAFRDAALGLFPRVPAAELAAVVARATRKRSGRVGRAGALGLGPRAALAVRAPVRHAHTDYDRLMRGSGLGRERARAETRARVQEVMRLWGGETRRKGGERAKRNERCPGAGSTTRGSGTKGKPMEGTVSRSRKAATKLVGALGREKKHNVRRTGAVVAARRESPETEGVVTRRSPRRAAGGSLRDDADSESEESKWPSSEEDSDEEWTEH